MIRKILFITWDGPNTTYLERLFLPIFSGLGEHGFQFHVLQFSWATANVVERRASECHKRGIPYANVRVSRHFGSVGPFVSALFGARTIRHLVSKWGIDCLLPRSLMPALSVLSLRRHEQRAMSIIFDADGLAVDERVDFGKLSPHSLTYRLLRDVEAELLRRSDGVLMRTTAARSILLARAGSALSPDACAVISNGVDPAPFQSALGGLSVADRQGFTLCYCGSIGSQYRLSDMLETACLLKAEMPDLCFRLLSPGGQEIEHALAVAGLSEADWITWNSIPPERIPNELVRCDLGLALREASFSSQAVMPIKLGEYLLAGMPVIGTPGVGDTAMLEAEGVFRSAERPDLHETIRWIREEVRPQRSELRQKSHNVGIQHFSLQQTIEQYRTALDVASLHKLN